EGEGDKLERIAADENIPAARVRQRVSRMRRWMKERWLAEVALVAALGVAAFIVYKLLRKPHEAPIAVPEPQPTVQQTAPPIEPAPERARALRGHAFERCDASDWQACLDLLDEAKELDPAGDTAPDVTNARQRAHDALSPSPAPTSTSS